MFANGPANTVCLLVVLFAGCSKGEPAGNSRDDVVRHGVRLSQLRSHPIRSIDFWRTSLKKDLPNRIAPAPDELIEYMHLDNAFQGYDDRPISAKGDAGFIGDVRLALGSFPAKVKTLLAQALVGVALVRKSGASAYAEVVADAQGHPQGGLIVVDSDALKRTANEWASWKDMSAFRPAPDLSIDVVIEPAAANNRVNALRYILLHEIGHLVDYRLGITPLDGGNTQNISNNGFFALSWEDGQSTRSIRLGDKIRSRYDSQWQGREELKFYTFDASAHSMAVARDVYTWLAGTSFPTLYAASSSADDFADSFANYVHVVLSKRPYVIRIHRGKTVEFEYTSCWKKKPCATKRKTMEALYDKATSAIAPR